MSTVYILVQPSVRLQEAPFSYDPDFPASKGRGKQMSIERIIPMYIDDFIWLPDVVEKLVVKHHVTQDETEEVFFNHPQYCFVESGHRAR